MLVVIATLIFAGCFSKILIIVLYNKLVEDSFRVADSGSELIKQIKLRYSNQLKLELPIQDIEKFVGRYIYQYSKVIKFINVLDMLSLIVMLLGLALNYEKQYFDTEVLFIAMFIYMSVGLLVNSDKRERIIISNITDYLSNNMNTRMVAREHRVQIKESIKAESEYEKSADNEEKKDEADESIRINAKSSDIAHENAIIEEVLREFLQA